MSLVLRNLQRAVPLRRAPLRRQVEVLRAILGVQKYDLGVICVDNERIRRINRTYRGKNVPTDVLSFPFHEVRSISPRLVGPAGQGELPVLAAPRTVARLCFQSVVRIRADVALRRWLTRARHWGMGDTGEFQGHGGCGVECGSIMNHQ